jgi:hypothetical protein
MFQRDEGVATERDLSAPIGIPCPRHCRDARIEGVTCDQAIWHSLSTMGYKPTRSRMPTTDCDATKSCLQFETNPPLGVGS